MSWIQPVYFEFDSADLTPAARDTLNRLHGWLSAHGKTIAKLEGHADEHGTTEYNVALGQKRAQAVADFLARLGTDRKRLDAVSFGSERPAADGHDESAWSRNRRVEFRVDR
jgi:peptidoglycan-associated lipoprotein